MIINWLWLFAFMSTTAFLALGHSAFKALTKSEQSILVAIVLLKSFLALSMGHLDISRFIVFLQNFAQNPASNPWDFTLTSAQLKAYFPPSFGNELQSDFPYPPLLMYLHSIPYFFKNLLLRSSEFGLGAIDYMLIRIPLLFADALLVRHFIRTQNPALFVYACSPLLIFHQFYSGQLDLIAAIPFFMALHFLSKEKWLNSFLFFSISLALKPYAILFFPILFLAQKNIRLALKVGLILLSAFVVFKISELPYGLTAKYSEKMGAGAKILLEPSFLKFYASIICIFIILRWKKNEVFLKHQWTIQNIIIFSIAIFVGELEYHSAGWMVWPLLALVFTLKTYRIIPSTMIWLWGLSFILRWSFITHSPLLDSFDVFLRNFTLATDFFGMGFPYRFLQSHFSVQLADLILSLSFRQYEMMTTIMLLTAGYRVYTLVRGQLLLKNLR